MVFLTYKVEVLYPLRIKFFDVLVFFVHIDVLVCHKSNNFKFNRGSAKLVPG